MPPKKCSCKRHATYSKDDEDGAKVLKISNKKIRRKAIDALIENGDIAKHSTYLCESCAQYAEHNLANEQLPAAEPDYIGIILNKIEQGEISEDDLCRISFCIGKSQHASVFKDSVSCSHQYKESDILETFDCEEWLTHRNKIILHFLSGISADEKNVVKLTTCVEEMYSLTNNLFVAPFAFTKNLVIYFLTGSKGAANVNSATTPSGCYTTLNNWVKDQSKEKLQCPKDHDIVSFFDNNQVIQRKWRVEHNFKSSSSVITNIIHISPSTTSHLQTKQHLSPKNWMRFGEKDKKDLVKKMQENNNDQNEIFRKYRDQFIIDKLNVVCNQQQKTKTGAITDHIDEKEDIFARNYPSADERYTFVPSGHSDEKVEIKMGDPCFENPCSYESVEKVFDHILNIAEVGSNRSWTVMGCDGLPYTLGSRIMDETYECPVCHMVYLSFTEFQEHRTDFDHALDHDKEFCKKYNNILLIPGLGHFEINMLKAIFKLLWDVCLIDLAKLLGFKSPKALASCQSAADHHKSWQIFQIFLHGMSEELVLPYCRKCIANNETPSLKGYYSWIPSVSFPNYKFLCEAVFTYCLALHVFRAGVRRNNSEVIHASKAKFAPLFFGLNMPFYMETYIRDSFIRLQCPPEIYGFIEQNESYSVSGNDTKGEGGDFILEAKNRITKRLIPAGVPDNNTWLHICRNIDRFGKIESNMNSQLGIKSSDDSYSYQVDLSREIFHFRKNIRNRNYVTKSGNQTSLSGQELDSNLQNFSVSCKENMEDFLNYIISNDLSSRKKYQPIFITQEARKKFSDLENQKKDELIKSVENKLMLMDENSVKQMYNKKWKKLKSKTKAGIINFLNEINEL